MTDLEAKAEAIRRHASGRPVQFGKTLDGLMTHGYGTFINGAWEFPLPYAYLSPEQQKLVCDADARQIQSELRDES